MCLHAKPGKSLASVQLCRSKGKTAAPEQVWIFTQVQHALLQQLQLCSNSCYNTVSMSISTFLSLFTAKFVLPSLNLTVTNSVILCFQTNQLKNPSSGKCLTVEGGQVIVMNCSSTKVSHRWALIWLFFDMIIMQSYIIFSAKVPLYKNLYLHCNSKWKSWLSD